MPEVHATFIDRAVGFFSPTLYAGRIEARARAALLLSSYNAADSTRTNRLTAGQGGTGDSHLKPATLWELREKHRTLERNNAIFGGLLRCLVDNCISTGIDWNLTSGDKGWNTDAEAALYDWADDPTRVDARGQVDFWERQRIAALSEFRDGDVLEIKRKEGFLQAVEADQLVSPNWSTIPNGIEFDGNGKPTTYHVCPSGSSRGSATGTIYPINAKAVVHLFRANRFTQSRGVPAFSANLNTFTDIDEWIQAEILAAKLNAFWVGKIKQDNHTLPGLDTETQPSQFGGTDYHEKWDPATVFRLAPGEDAEMVNAARPGQTFPDSVRTLFRVLGLNWGLPLELTLLDVSKANYSSVRAGLLEAHRTMRAWQRHFWAVYIRPIITWVMDRLSREGVIKRARPVDWYKCEPLYPGWPWVDPVQDMEASQLALDMGVTTLRDIAGELGRDWQEMLTQRGNELLEIQQREAKDGISFTPTKRVSFESDKPGVPEGAQESKPKKEE